MSAYWLDSTLYVANISAPGTITTMNKDFKLEGNIYFRDPAPNIGDVLTFTGEWRPAVPTGGGGSVTLSSAGGAETLVNDGVSPSLAIKGLTAGNGVSLTGNSTAVTVASTNIQILEFLDPVGVKGNLVQVVYNDNTIAGVKNIINEGVFEWAFANGGSDEENGTSISTETNGFSYVTGTFGGTVTFGGLFTLISSGDPGFKNTFVGFIDPNGVWQWASQVTSASPTVENESTRITNDCNGNAYVAGGIGSGNSTFGSITVAGPGSYIAKINNLGVWQWVIVSSVAISDMKSDCEGNVYVSGTFTGSVTFGSTILTALGTRDIFVAKMDTTGAWLWANQAGNTATFQPTYQTLLTFDYLGNVYITGVFAGTTYFDAIELIANTSNTMFVGKLDYNGVWMWVFKPTSLGNSESLGEAIEIDLKGNLYISGTNYGPADMTLDTITIPAQQSFIGKLNVSKITREWIWINVHDSRASGLKNIVLNQKGDVYAFANISNTGIITYDYNFGPFTFTINPLGGALSQTLYFKLDNDGNWLWYLASNLTNVNGPAGMAIDFHGNLYTTGYFFGGITFSPFSIGGSGRTMFINKIRTSDVGTIGLLAANTTLGNNALVAFPGGTPVYDTFASALVPSYNYFIDSTGTFSDCGCFAQRFLGTAMNSTTLMTGTSKGVNIFYY